jgi:hypothetical protein
VKESPPPLLSKTVLVTFTTHGSSVKRLLSSARHQHIVFPSVVLWDEGNYMIVASIRSGLFIVAMSMEQLTILVFVLSAFGLRNNVINF